MPLLHTTRLPQGAKFSPQRAERAVKFVERACVHTKSNYKGKPFELYPWQRGSYRQDPNTGIWQLDGLIAPLFGAVRWSDLYQQYVRQYNLAWLELARKNGKSEVMAALGLYLLIFDGEYSAEIYGCASDKDQASMVFDVARDMIHLSPMLRRMKERRELLVIDSRKRIVYTPTRSTYRVVAADAAGNLGENPHAVLFDEVLAQPNDDLWSTMLQGFGTRPQQLQIAVTTAGPKKDSFAYTEHEFSMRVADNPDEDPSRFVYMAFVDEGADWRDESLWPEANPALSTVGGFLDIDQLRKEKRTALSKGDLSAVAKFKIYRLNQWGEQEGAWLDANVWDDSEDQAGEFTEEDLQGLRAVGGFDLAEQRDFSAWVVVFFDEARGRVLVKPHYWLTRSALETIHKKRLARVLRWIDEGYVTLFETEVHDYDAIRERIAEDVGKYGIQMFGYDPWQAPSTVNYVKEQTGATDIKVPQTTMRMDAGSKELTRLMGLRSITSNHNPVLRFNVENSGYLMDKEKRVKPHKANSSGNIDGLQALVIALVVDQTAEDPGEVTFHVIEECPSCGTDEIVQMESQRRCRECGHVWEVDHDDE